MGKVKLAGTRVQPPLSPGTPVTGNAQGGTPDTNFGPLTPGLGALLAQTEPVRHPCNQKEKKKNPQNQRFCFNSVFKY